MRAIAVVAASLAICGCGPEVAGDAGESGSAGSSSDADTSASATTGASTTSAGTTFGSSASTSDSSASGEADESGELRECVQGTWSGLFSSGFEWVYFQECGQVEPWWFENGAPQTWCDTTVWVVVEGTRCGPGNYGHLGGYTYELSGTVVEGPCTADACTGAPEACGTFEELCQLDVECDVLAQDCPAGERCVPTSADGFPPWTGASCMMLPPMPVGLGEPCATAGPWQDDCDAGRFCVPDAQGSDVGVCAPLCDPSQMDSCGAEACWFCNSAVLTIGVCNVAQLQC
jgi:hypothetical protein